MPIRGAVTLSLGLLLLCGCQNNYLAPFRQLEGEDDNIQAVVEQKLRQQSESLDGDQRLAAIETNDYQDDEELERYTVGLDTQQQRRRAARALVEAGPISIVEGIMLCLEFNDQIQASRADLRAVGGEELVVRSRFLPHLSYVLAHEHASRKIAGRQGDTDNLFRYSQTLLEFGKDNPDDVFLREAQRRALFSYEDSVRDVLSSARRVFFTVLMRQEQIQTRRNLLAEFEAKYENIRQREREQIEAQEALATARLNVLNEKSRINALEKEIRRLKFELLRLLGLTVGTASLELAGELEAFTLDIDSAVNLAQRRSTSVAQARARLFEQARLARQIWWENSPDLSLRGGWQDGENQAAVDVFNDDGTYKVDALAETQMGRREGSLEDELDPAAGLLAGDQSGWFLDFGLEVPILDGYEQRGKLIRERARLIRMRHELRDAIVAVDLDVRQAYQTLLQRRQEVEFQRETVDLAKQRLDAKEELRQIGRITDNELETFRNQFFDEQDGYFLRQIDLVDAQEQLRARMRYFEPLPPGIEQVKEAEE